MVDPAIITISSDPISHTNVLIEIRDTVDRALESSPVQEVTLAIT